jgi:hypothetical protein
VVVKSWVVVVEGGCGRVLSDGELLMDLWLDALGADSF